MWFLSGLRHMFTKHRIIFISIGFGFMCNLTVSGIRLFFEKTEMFLFVALDTVFINFQIFLLEFHSLSHLFLKLCFNVVHILFAFSYWFLFTLLFDWFFYLRYFDYTSFCTSLILFWNIKLLFVCFLLFSSSSIKITKGCSLFSSHHYLSLEPILSFFINFLLSSIYFCSVFILAYLSFAFFTFYSSTRVLKLSLSIVFSSRDFSLLRLLSFNYLSSSAR